MRRRWVRASWVPITCGLLVSCQTIEEIENPPLTTGNPAAVAGDHALDSDLCWQEVRAGSSGDGVSEAEAIEDAHAACMRAKGWDR
jgi:hypothetical protein